MLAKFFKKDLAGVYFSTKGVVFIQQSSGRIKTQLCVPYPSAGSDNAEMFSDDIFEVFKNKEDEMMAFLQKAIRDSKLETKDIVLALPPKDLIIRFFEMPNIPMAEVVAGINFEMKKYIPFKVEELVFDFQYRIKPKTKILEVLLCGIRQDSLGRYLRLFKQLQLDVKACEPGLFSLFRLLVIKNKISSQHSYVILEFNNLEANILIVERSFSYFTRDIKLASSKIPGKPSEELDAILFRLINEVRVSLDYYRRQFLRKDVDEMLIISTKEHKGIADSFTKDLGLKVNFISLDDLFKLPNAPVDMLSDISKAYGAALRNEKPGLVTLNLAKSRQKSETITLALLGVSGVSPQELIANLLKEFKAAISKGITIGVIIFLAVYGLGFSKLFPLEKKYAAVTVKQPPLLAGVDLSSLESVKASEQFFKEKEKDFKNLTENYSPVFKKLLILPELLPSGIWLSYLKYTTVPMTMDLSCFSYAETSQERSDNINNFITQLSASKDFNNDLGSIDLRSYREVSKEDVFYLQFDIHAEKK